MDVKQYIRDLHWVLRKKWYMHSELNGSGDALPLMHIAHWGGNSGDTILSDCVRKTITHFIGNKPNWSFIPVRKKVDKHIIECINRNNAVIVGGGGLFLPDSNSNSISGWQWAISRDQLESIHVPLLVYSVGYNYFPGQEPTELFVDSLNILAKKADFFGLRNMGSIRVVRRLLKGELADKVTYQPCTTTLINKLIPSKKNERDKKNIAVNMAFDREKARFGEQMDTICSQVAKAIKKIEMKGYKIFYVAHCGNDDKFLPYLDREAVSYSYKNLTRSLPMDAIEFYRRMGMVLGMRGHAQMVPFGTNTEIISLGTHDKMRWFLEDIDAMEWYIDLRDDVDSLLDRIIDRFENVHETNSEETNMKLIDKQDKLFDITQNNWVKIQSILERKTK